MPVGTAVLVPAPLPRAMQRAEKQPGCCGLTSPVCRLKSCSFCALKLVSSTLGDQCEQPSVGILVMLPTASDRLCAVPCIGVVMRHCSYQVNGQHEGRHVDELVRSQQCSAASWVEPSSAVT